MSLRCVLFDLDGTLVNTLPAMVATFNAVLSPVLGRPIPDAEIVSRLGPPLVEIFRQYRPEQAAELTQAYVETYESLHRTYARSYPGVPEVLAELHRRGCRVGVVTSKRRGASISTLVAFGLDRYVEVLVAEEDVPRLKPDPEPVRQAARLLGVPPNTALMVGDSPGDIGAARAAGARSGAALWGFHPSDLLLLERPDHTLNDPTDILSLVPAATG